MVGEGVGKLVEGVVFSFIACFAPPLYCAVCCCFAFLGLNSWGGGGGEVPLRFYGCFGSALLICRCTIPLWLLVVPSVHDGYSWVLEEGLMTPSTVLCCDPFTGCPEFIHRF